MSLRAGHVYPGMALVEADISMSVDGYVTGPEPDRYPGYGRGGERLHAWLGHEEGRRLSSATFAASGAVITGRRVYDDTDGWASENGFFRMPVFVVTHRPHDPVTRGDTTFTFVPGVAGAVAAAKAAAGNRHVHIMGGGSVIGQALRAGLVDRLRLHIVPLILGSGTALFDGEPGPALEREETVDTPGATHVTYRCA